MNLSGDFTVANAITIVVWIVTCAVGWQKLKERTEANSKRIQELEDRCKAYDRLITEIAVLSNDLQWLSKNIGDLADSIGQNRGGTGHDVHHSNSGTGGPPS